MEIQHSRLSDKVNSGSSISDRTFARAKDALERAGTSLNTFGDRIISLATSCLENLPTTASVRQRLQVAALCCLALNSTKCGMSADFGNDDANTDATADSRDSSSDQADSDSPEVTIRDATEEEADTMDAALDSEDASLDGDSSLDGSDVADAQDGDVTDGDADADVVLPPFDVVMPPMDVPTPVDVRDVVEEEASAMDVPDESADVPEDRPVIRPDVRDVVEEEASADSGVISDAALDSVDASMPDVVSLDVPDVLDRPDVIDSSVPDSSDVLLLDVRDVLSEPEVSSVSACGGCYSGASYDISFTPDRAASFPGTNYYVTRVGSSLTFQAACFMGGGTLNESCTIPSSSAGSSCSIRDGNSTLTFTFVGGSAPPSVRVNLSVSCM